MPQFKTTKDIFNPSQNIEAYDENIMNANFLILPPQRSWNYVRDIQIEDVDLWEIIYESGGWKAVYASWSPYAEYYMVIDGWNYITKSPNIETYYGKLANKRVIEKMKTMGIPFSINKVWADPDDMWLYSDE